MQTYVGLALIIRGLTSLSVKKTNGIIKSYYYTQNQSPYFIRPGYGTSTNIDVMNRIVFTIVTNAKALSVTSFTRALPFSSRICDSNIYSASAGRQ